MRPPTHTHYDPAMPPRQVPGTLLWCNDKDRHSPTTSELWADYRYAPQLMPSQDTGLRADLERDLIAAYEHNRAVGTGCTITDVSGPEGDDGNGSGPIRYRVTVTNRTGYESGKGPVWHTEAWGLYGDGEWRSIPDNPHPGYAHTPPFCANCGY